MTPSIRLARQDDAAELARLFAQLGYPAERATLAARLAAIEASPRHAVFVAEGAPAGTLGGTVAVERRLMVELGEPAELVALVVDADVRRGGVGRALVAAARQWAQAQGCELLMVRSNVARDESHPFYRGLGFVQRKTQHVYELPLR